MRCGSLFTGIGGFDEGFRRAGIETVWQVEKDESCQRVLRRRFTHDPGPDLDRGGFSRAGDGHQKGLRVDGGGPVIHADVTAVGGYNLAPVDLVCGGFPCQDLSVAGRRAGLAGERSGLWYEFRRILEEMAPRWAVIENVPGLLSSDGGRDMAVILRSLAELGYGWAYRVLDAQYFGVPQRRRRVFIVGCLGNPAAAAQVLFEPESCGGDPPPSRQAREGVACTLTSGSGGGHYDRQPMTFVPEVSYSVNGVGSKFGSGRHNQDTFVTHTLTTRRAVEEDGTGRGVPLTVADGMAVRRLTPTECERLQGFPDGWTDVDGMSDSARYRMLGNAVAVPVAAWIGRRIQMVSVGRRIREVARG